jgi:hypothetical protein
MKKIFTLLSIFLLILSCSSDETSTQSPIAKHIITLSAGEGGSVSTSGGEYEKGQTVSVTATPQGEYLFTGWSDGITDATRTITIDATMTITANFEKKKYPLTVNIEGEGEVLEEIVNTGRTTDYNSGTTVKLTAAPAEGWEFVGWAGALNGNSNPQQLLVIEPISIQATFQELEPVSKPSEVLITSKDYSLELKWNYNSDSRIDSVLIYKSMGSSQNFSLFKAIRNDSQSIYFDNLVGVRESYFYKIFYKVGNDLSEPSDIISASPLEPINNNTPLNGEIGGIHYAYWDFDIQTFNKIKHRFTIHEEPTNKDGSANNDGLYYQFYQGIMNDTIGFYYGIQTRLRKPSGEVKKGIIFSRWKTRDKKNYAVSNGGWGESAGYEGDFIGIRKNYEWEVGQYEIGIQKDSTDVIGDWYGLKIKNISTNVEEYIGSLRFEKSTKSTGMKSGGITWSELYTKLPQNTPIPNWHVSVNSVYANESYTPKRVYLTYSDSKFLEFSNIYTTNNIDVHFLMGPNVKRTVERGYINLH